MLNLFNKKIKLESTLEKTYLRINQSDIDKIFTRLFFPEEGKKPIAYLKHTISQRSCGPTSSEEQLRFHDGQRHLIQMIIKMAERGHQ